MYAPNVSTDSWRIATYKQKESEMTITMESVSEGRGYLEEYLRLVGDDYSPTTKGIASLAGKLGVSAEHLHEKIMAYLTARRSSSQ